jgi:hypothetical protein
MQSGLRLRRIPTLDGKGQRNGAGQQVSLYALALITGGHEREHLEPDAKVLQSRSGGVAKGGNLGGSEPIAHRSPSILGRP